MSYGGKSNAELLSQYGFVDPDNGQEAVYIRMGEHLTASEEKMTLIAELLEVAATGNGRGVRNGLYGFWE